MQIQIPGLKRSLPPARPLKAYPRPLPEGKGEGIVGSLLPLLPSIASIVSIVVSIVSIAYKKLLVFWGMEVDFLLIL